MGFFRSLAALTAWIGVVIAQPAAAQLSEVTGFGSNPGNLKMWTYLPAQLPASAPLVVMMHGCGQTPQDVDVESGWIQMADAYKFALLFPQTTFSESSILSFPCFRSYDSAQNRRGVGEALSIKQMTDWMLSHYPLDAKRVFATGFSSGAIETSVMMASYPEVFAAGAIMSGHPYGCATSYTQFVLCNLLGSSKTPQQWGDLIRSAYPGYKGPYPRVSIWHGTLDTTIRESNAGELVKQWTNANGIDQTADEFSQVNGYPHYVYTTPGGQPRVEHYVMTNASHAIQINITGPYLPKCGSIGGVATQPSFICSVFYAAKWFGIAQ